MTKHILIADQSHLFAGVTSSILTKAGFDVIVSHTLSDALYALDNFQFLSYIVDTHLKDASGFELVAKIRDKEALAKIIMTSELDTDEQLDSIIKNEVSLLLIKPFPKTELVGTVKRLITGQNIFGLENYLRGTRHLKRIKLTNSHQVRPAIQAATSHMTKWGFEFFNQMEIELTIQEMLTNAVYHSHGFTKEKEMQEMVHLNKGDEVHLRFGCDEFKFGVSISDFKGVLTKKRIYETLLNNLRQAQILEQVRTTGKDPGDIIIPTGRGLDMVRKLSGEYYFNIEHGTRTEIIILFDSRYDKDDHYSSIKIFESDQNDAP